MQALLSNKSRVAVAAQSSRRAPLHNLALAQRFGERPQLELVGIERDEGFSPPSGLVLP